MNKNIKKAIYAGSFDPPTNGHLWIIEEASKLFDKRSIKNWILFFPKFSAIVLF